MSQCCFWIEQLRSPSLKVLQTRFIAECDCLKIDEVRALEDFERAQQLDPANAIIHVNLAKFYLAMGDGEDHKKMAEAELDKAMKIGQTPDILAAVYAFQTVRTANKGGSLPHLTTTPHHDYEKPTTNLWKTLQSHAHTLEL